MAVMTSTEIISYVRTVLELSTDDVSDAKMTLFVNKWIEFYGGTITDSNQWLITYYTALDSLRSIIFSYAVSSSTNGTVSRRIEQRGAEQIQEYYDTSSSSQVGYQTTLDLLLANPDYIHPSLKPSVLNVYVGNTSVADTNEVKRDPDSRSAALGVGWMFDEEHNLNGTEPQPRLYPRGTYGEF